MTPLAGGNYAPRNRPATRRARHFAPWPTPGLAHRLTLRGGDSMLICRAIVVVATVVAAIAGLSVPAVAQTPEQFYGGTNVDLVIGYPPGGSNDTYARVLARHLGKHIPGNPAVVP